MATFEQAYCQRHGCSPAQFTEQVFWRCLPPLARLALPSLIAMFNPIYFSPDHELIQAAGRADNMSQIDHQIMEFQDDSRNDDWWRRRARVRISTRRLRRLAHQYFPRESRNTPVPGR